MIIEAVRITELADDVIEFLQDNGEFFTNYSWYKDISNNVFGLKESLFIVVRDNHNVKAVFPVLLRNDKFGYKFLRSLSNYYSPIFTIVDKDAKQRKFTKFIFTCLKNNFISWDVIDIRPISADECSELVEILNACSIPCVSFFCFKNWFYSLDEKDYNAYIKDRPSRVKNTIKRKLGKFNSVINSEIVLITDSINVDKAVSDYEYVYSKSWKNEEPYPDFIREIVRSAASTGNLRMAVAYINNIPIAAQIWFVADKSAYIYKLAYDENYKQYSPGTLLTATLMKYVINEDHVRTIDYLTGDDNYKKEWMDESRDRWGVIAFNKSTVRGYLMYLIEVFKLNLKNNLNNLIIWSKNGIIR
jgi:hypothetical protein